MFIIENKRWQQKAHLKDSTQHIFIQRLLYVRHYSWPKWEYRKNPCQLQAYNLIGAYSLMLTNNYYPLDKGYK